MSFFKKITVFFTLLIFILLVIYFFYGYSNKKDEVRATSSNSLITTTEDWNLGTLSNVTNSEGTMTINDKTVSYSSLDVSEIYSSVSAEANTEDAYLTIDDLLGTNWSASCPDEGIPCPSWEVDLGQNYDIAGFKLSHGGVATIEASQDNVAWSNFGDAVMGPADWDAVVPGIPQSARYIKITEGGGFGVSLGEFELYESGGTATHTTAATQIDGQEGSEDKDVIEWTSFTPTQTTPANTSISYEFRTSDDGATWSDWSASQEYTDTALDLTALTPSRYLQVRSTLSTTDAAATPQIDEYTINFHNNVAPNKPTAQTAIIGD